MEQAQSKLRYPDTFCDIQLAAKISNCVRVIFVYFNIHCLGSHVFIFTMFIVIHHSLQFVREVLSALAAANAFGVHHLVPRPDG